MLWNIFSFEVKYWLKSWMLWIFFFLTLALAFFSTSTDKLILGSALPNTFRNAPYVIQNVYAFMGIFSILFTTAFVNSSAARDFNHNTYQIMFSMPISRFDFLVGRFLGATVTSIIPLIGVSFGILLAKYMPWNDPERWGPVSWNGHLQGILVFAIPDAVIFAGILFAIAVVARNDIASFVGAILLIVADATTQSLLTNVERQKLAALIDPLCLQGFAVATRYWTVAEKNVLSVSLTGMIFWNRLIWFGVALLMFLFAYYRFSFSEKTKKSRKVVEPFEVADSAPTSFSQVSFNNTGLSRFFGLLDVHLLGVIKSPVFIIILIVALLNCIPSLALDANQLYGNKTFPVTYFILDIIKGTFYMFLMAIITYFAGLLVWKDRDTKMDEIIDSQPSPEWVSYASRQTSLFVIVFIIQTAIMLAGIVVQASQGYHRFQLELYAKELFLRDGSLFLFFSVLAFFIHVFSPNKYIGYFVYVLFLAANAFAWQPLNVVSNLVQFSNRPTVIYSDFYKDAPFRASWNWFDLYWLLFCSLLAILTVMLWPRGKQPSWPDRFRIARLRFRGAWPVVFAGCLIAFCSVGAWAYYNTKVLNTYVGPKDRLRLQADYEKTYKGFDKKPMPRLRDIQYNIDIFPEQRNLVLKADAVIENPYNYPLDEIHLTMKRLYETSVDIPGATLEKDDKRLFYRIYKFSPPLAPGEKRTAHFVVKTDTRGFENELSNRSIVQDGTFFNNAIAPSIGYNTENELTDPADRKKYGLGEQQFMPPLEKNCTANCMDTYLGGHSDWLNMDTVISTSPDQIAIAPGSLEKEWTENGRRYFHYKLDHPSLSFCSFISARYEVAREDWNGIKIEVYYIKDHPWNVPRMIKSVEKSLDYYTKNFGPYYHKEARVIEFPRIDGQFAQAFPGTMPHSESIGFISNFTDPEDIDLVYYVVAHEMGHQWWAHQVVGANMRGATVLSESLAQYSALMVMEKEYGRDIMRKFLRYEMDRYLAARGRELQKERPLMEVEADQGYVHYRKASVVLYYLKEMIGEEAMNRALRRIVEKYAYASAPYPTSWVLVDELKKETPPEYQYLLKDLFEDITIFSNRTLKAETEKRADGKYDVTLDIETRKYKADAKGNETEVPLDDWIEIGAFAKPDKGKKYGKTLYRQRIHLTSNKSTQKFTVDELPDSAGVDPFALLIDRVPDDNVQKPELVTQQASKQ